MEGKAEACGKSTGLGTPKFPMPARTTFLAAQIGHSSEFVLGT
jgi:hypothetical protein